MWRSDDQEDIGIYEPKRRKVSPWLIWGYLVLLGTMVYVGRKAEFVGPPCMTALLMMGATWITWTRLPTAIQEFITFPIIAGVMDILVGLVGWFILPNSTHIKIGFILFHIGISFALFWEHDRLRGRVKWPWQYVMDLIKSQQGSPLLRPPHTT
jgi:hypothetical protein